MSSVRWLSFEPCINLIVWLRMLLRANLLPPCRPSLTRLGSFQTQAKESEVVPPRPRVFDLFMHFIQDVIVRTEPQPVRIVKVFKGVTLLSAGTLNPDAAKRLTRTDHWVLTSHRLGPSSWIWPGMERFRRSSPSPPMCRHYGLCALFVEDTALNQDLSINTISRTTLPLSMQQLSVATICRTRPQLPGDLAIVATRSFVKVINVLSSISLHCYK